MPQQLLALITLDMDADKGLRILDFTDPPAEVTQAIEEMKLIRELLNGTHSVLLLDPMRCGNDRQKHSPTMEVVVDVCSPAQRTFSGATLGEALATAAAAYRDGGHKYRCGMYAPDGRACDQVSVCRFRIVAHASGDRKAVGDWAYICNHHLEQVRGVGLATYEIQTAVL